jgi:hypothetical protein
LLGTGVEHIDPCVRARRIPVEEVHRHAVGGLVGEVDVDVEARAIPAAAMRPFCARCVARVSASGLDAQVKSALPVAVTWA